MFCTRCWSQIPDGMRFCTNCGAPVAGAAAAQPAQAARQTGEAPGAPAPTGQQAASQPTGAQPAASQAFGAQPAGAAPAAAPAGMAPGETTQMPRPAAPQQGPGSTAPGIGDLPPTIPQDDIAFQPKKRMGRGPKIALIALACVLVAAVVGGATWLALGALTQSAPTQEADKDAPDADDAGDVPEAVRLDLEISSLDTSSYPQVSLDIEVEGADADVVDALTAADFLITETTPDGGSSEPAATRATVSDAGDEIRLVYTSELGEGASRTVKVRLDEMSGAAGTATASFTAPTSDDDADDAADDADDDYMIADSATRRLSASDLSGYTDWELYVARNEIYARHGRRFQNQDLQTYFDGKDWYEPLYSPEEFDANVTLSDVEIANAETIRSVEQSRGSSYL